MAEVRVLLTDVAAGWFETTLPEQTVIKVDTGFLAKGGHYLARRRCRIFWQAGHKVQCRVRVATRVHQLLEDFERIWAIPPTPYLERRGSQFLVFIGIVCDATSGSASVPRSLSINETATSG